MSDTSKRLKLFKQDREKGEKCRGADFGVLRRSHKNHISPSMEKSISWQYENMWKNGNKGKLYIFL